MKKHPPQASTGIFSDIRQFFLHKPEIVTGITFHSEDDRELFSKSILQRTDIGVDKFRVLNIHRIGIEAPSTFVFEELLKWNGNSSCWPNHIAKVSLENGCLENIRINLFGLPVNPFAVKRRNAVLNLFHLFNLNAINIQKTPAPFDFDNARYLLYQCSGGYPIGVFSMYVRFSIPERGEKEISQLFMMMGFNFYGKKTLTTYNFINKVWELIHNRVTSNIMNRFKLLVEWQFEKFVNE